MKNAQTIEIRKGIQISLDDLVQSLSSMDMSDLQRLAEKMNHMVDLRLEPTAAKAEKKIVQQIRQMIPDSVVRRYGQLRKKHHNGTLTNKEAAEIRTLTDFMEEKSAERIFLLGLLAQKRNVSLPDLIRQFPLPTHA